MCGRYALALRPGQIRQRLEDDNMPVYHGIPDDDDHDHDDGGGGDSGASDAPPTQRQGAPRQSYNFCPGYHGVVYRAEVPDWGAGPRRRGQGESDGYSGGGDDDDDTGAHEQQQQQQHTSSSAKDHHHNSSDTDKEEVKYKLQSMKWGLVPFWTKRNPDYGTMLKTINCRDDSLAQSGGMWASMKARKRCVVVAQGFYEWLKKDGVKDKIPHYIKRKDGKLMCMAGLWDVVQYEEDDYKHYTYTIITTNSNKQLSFLHDRMPVILENGSDEVRTWLDPSRHEWSAELQALLQPWEEDGLEIYPVSKDVGKVGNNSPTFIIPIDSKENKNNIANFFTSKLSGGGGMIKKTAETRKHIGMEALPEKKKQIMKTEYESQPEIDMTADRGFIAEDEDNHDQDPQVTPIKRESSPSQPAATTASLKRKAFDTDLSQPPLKKERLDGSPEEEEEKNEEKPSPRTTTTRSNATTSDKPTAPSPSSSSPQKRPTTEQRTTPGKARPPRTATSRPKISATSNGTKAPTGKKDGMQKITKFFGNSA